MTSIKKPRLLILSDLWGTKNSEWLCYYSSILNQHFDTEFYSCTELAEIDLVNLAQEEIHQRFTNGGIDKAVEKLLKLKTENCSILGFSIGGAIAWQAALEGLKVDHLFAISATRLRYQTEKPTAKIQLLFGDLDNYLPEKEWFEEMNIKRNCIVDQNHEMYREKEIAREICGIIKKQFVLSL